MPDKHVRRTFRPRRTSARRAGSALLIVLGLLAVLMMLGISFSVFVQTEHSGTTNLKNGIVARQSLHSAVGRVMEAIDRSFVSPSNDWPVCVWPQAWLASSENKVQDYYQSEIRSEGEPVQAHILTAEAAKFLTPSQLALAKSAKCGWAPIFGAIRSEKPVSTKPKKALVGTLGRNEADSVIGRYAFIAIETTGLLDANAAGSEDGTSPVSGQKPREENAGEYPFTYILPDKNEIPEYSYLKYEGNNSSTTVKVKVPHVLDDYGAFLEARNKTKDEKGIPQIPSFADLRAVAGDALDETKPEANSNDETELAKKPFPADLFNTFYASLSDLDPEGEIKTVLPSAGKIGTMTDAKAESFARQAFRAMTRTFAQARETSGKDSLSAGSLDGDGYTFFPRVTDSKYSLSRARLATAALLDAMDPDDVPGTWKSAGFSVWSALGDMNESFNVVKSDGNTRRVTVFDEKPKVAIRASPLNFPNTEAPAMLSRVYAYVEFEDPEFDEGPDMDKYPEKASVVIPGTLVVGGVVATQNYEPDGGSRKFTVEVDCDLLTAKPDRKTVSGVTGASEDDVLLGLFEKNDEHREWTSSAMDDFEPKNHAIALFPKKSKKWESSGSVQDNSSTPRDRRFSFDREFEFDVRCFAADWPDNDDPPSDDVLDRCFEMPKDAPDFLFYPMTAAEENDDPDLFLPVRIRVTIKDSTGAVVQQIPAPAIDDDRKFWICVNPGIWHKPKSKNVAEPPKNHEKPWDRQYAVGWAMCAAPAFAFDTTSMTVDGYKKNGEPEVDGNEGFCNFWVNDSIARTKQDDSDVWTTLWEDMLDPDDAIGALAGGARAGDWNKLQTEWLATTENGKPVVNGWINEENTTVPDMFHAYSRSKTPFCCSIDGKLDSTKVKDQLASRISNKAFTSVGQLGNVAVGPYETLSTVRSYRYGDSAADFHPVLDYFTVVEDRFPNEEDREDFWNEQKKEYEWYAPDCPELFSGLARGRVNLNMPPLVRWTSKNRIRATTKGTRLNPHPVIAALREAALSSTKTGEATIDFGLASVMSTSIASQLLENGEKVENEKGVRDENGNGLSASRRITRRLSNIGNAKESASSEEFNPILKEIVVALGDSYDRDCEREAYIGNAANAFTTRGQTFVVVLRADAYTPRYGEESSTGDGTTLATTHAVLELFRDPEYARKPDGTPLKDANGNPVFFHNWYIKSFHVL